MRMINELHERLAEAEAYSNQELIWSLEDQRPMTVALFAIRALDGVSMSICNCPQQVGS